MEWKRLCTFSVFSPKQVDFPPNCSARSFMIKWKSYLYSLRKIVQISLGVLYFKLNMWSTSIFGCIMTMISNFTIFFYLKCIYLQVFMTNITDFSFSYDFCYLFVNDSIVLKKWLSSLYAPLKIYKKFFMQPLPMYTSCICHMFLSDNIADIEKSDGICSTTFVVDNYSGLLLYPSVFSIIDSRSAWIRNAILADFWYLLNSNILVSSEGITTSKKNLFSYTFLWEVCILV